MRRGSGWLHAKPCVGFARVSSQTSSVARIGKIAARFDYSAFFSSSPAGSFPSASSGVTTAVSGGAGSKARSAYSQIGI
ncbi:hypothetical protein Rleg_3179 [Rhizobium leguminosarum bv. trifolii WSM1325]|uniref:Uncharacterized protein n=1 Tax=Rhizobium leguminosarum bv. trifolii (strain WSM1325) TaxID=395491 RepID=C6ATU2_RHILS|nr:hypothetical protein Rleg_3179 [Rhizobium leguminosarum bv. trifolii WSM1325]